MMNQTEFLYGQLEVIAKDFPQVRIKYAFNNVIRTHIVELLPEEEYKFNSQLDDAWIPLSFRFREHFPDAEISFVSSDSTLSIKQPEFEFNTPNALLDLGFLSEIFDELSSKEISYTFPTCIPDRMENIGASINKVLSYPKLNLKKDLEDLDHLYQAAA